METQPFAQLADQLGISEEQIVKRIQSLYGVSYTHLGHCGAIDQEGRVLNDTTLDLLAREALSHASAGCDMVAPSDMMDGRVGALRQALDEQGFTHLPIMAYAAKYSSALYGPFRDAAESAPQFGDRKTCLLYTSFSPIE